MRTAIRLRHRVDLCIEGFLLTLLGATFVGALMFRRGSFGWSWDALNHHIYLGLVAESSRWDMDVAAAASQTYQYPYAYWFTYRLSLATGSGAIYNAVWAATQTVLLMTPVWLLICRLVPDGPSPWESRLYRALAFAFALASLPVIAALGTTANDVLSAVPLLWALALGLGFSGRQRAGLACAALLGASIAMKYSNILFLPALYLVWWQRTSVRLLMRSAVLMTLTLALGFSVAYAPWGYQLWRETGNAFYPHFSSWFQ